jgi:hypothetical protein
MTKAIQQQKELLTTALNALEAIERRETLYKAASIPSLKASYKCLLEISQIQYAETMANIHCITNQFADVDAPTNDADLLNSLDAYMMSLPTYTQSKEGFIQDAKMFFEAENR